MTSASLADTTSAQTSAERSLEPIDVLGLLAEAALANLDGGTSGDRYQVVIHVSAETRTSDLPNVDRSDPDDSVIELDHDAVHVSAETSRRLSCDASVMVMRHDDDGRVLEVGRRTRTIPPHIRRALVARDATCRVPGCTSRRCDAHHVAHWADGGPTRLENLVRLCRRHHRWVHEGGVRVTGTADGDWTFHWPDGQRMPIAPALSAGKALEMRARDADVASIPVWDGTPFDVAWAMDVLYERAAG